MGDPAAADAARRRRVPLDGLFRGGPPRLPTGRFLPGARCRGRRRPASCRAGLGVSAPSGPPCPRRADHGPVRRRAGAVLGGRRVRRRQPDNAADAAAAGIPRRGACRRRQAVGHAGRAVRSPVRGPVRTGDVRRRHGRRDPRRDWCSLAVRGEPRHAEHAAPARRAEHRGDGDQGHLSALREAGAAAVADRCCRRVDRTRGGVHPSRPAPRPCRGRGFGGWPSASAMAGVAAVGADRAHHVRGAATARRARRHA